MGLGQTVVEMGRTGVFGRWPGMRTQKCTYLLGKKAAGFMGQSRALVASPCPTLPSVLSAFWVATGEK